MKRNFGTERLTDLQVFLVHRVVLIPREAPETAFLPAGGQKRVVSTVVIDHVRVPATKIVNRCLDTLFYVCCTCAHRDPFESQLYRFPMYFNTPFLFSHHILVGRVSSWPSKRACFNTPFLTLHLPGLEVNRSSNFPRIFIPLSFDIDKF